MCFKVYVAVFIVAAIVFSIITYLVYRLVDIGLVIVRDCGVMLGLCPLHSVLSTFAVEMALSIVIVFLLLVAIYVWGRRELTRA